MLPEFGFQIPLEQSHYEFSDRHGKNITTGYEGDFWLTRKGATWCAW